MKKSHFLAGKVPCIALICTLLAVLAACGPQQSSSSTTSQPIKIGASLPLSGDRAPDGKALEQGYKLWRDAVNQHGGLLGRPVELDIVNDNSDTQQVVTDYQKLITVDKVDLIFAPFSSVLTLAGAPVAHRYGYAYLSGTGGIDSLYNLNLPENFNVSLPIRSYLDTFTQYILTLPQGKQPKTVAYIGEDNPFSTLQLANARKQLENSSAGLQTVLYQIYPESTVDYIPLIQKVIQSHADVVILGTHVNDSVAFINGFRQQHFNPKALVATGGPDGGVQFTDPIGGPQIAEGVSVPNGGWYPESKTYQNDQFVKMYLAAYGGKSIDINSGTAQGFAVGQVLEQAVKKIQSIDNAKLIQEMHSDTFDSVQGPVKFSDKGENIATVPYLFQWQHNQLIIVYPSDHAQAAPEFPKPQWP